MNQPCQRTSPSTTVPVGVRPTERATAFEAPCRGLMCATTRSTRCRNHPGDIGNQFAVLLAERGFADRLTGVVAPHDPVEPAFRPIERPSDDLPGIPGAELPRCGRLASDEGVQGGIVQQPGHLVGVLHTKWLERDPFASKGLRLCLPVQSHDRHGTRRGSDSHTGSHAW